MTVKKAALFVDLLAFTVVEHRQQTQPFIEDSAAWIVAVGCGLRLAPKSQSIGHWANDSQHT